MANNEQISQEVKVEETQQVSAEKQTTSEVKVEEKAVKSKEDKANKAQKQKKVRDKKPSKIGKRLKETELTPLPSMRQQQVFLMYATILL